MTDERKAKIKALRKQLANLSDAERQAIANRGIVTTVEGHTLSLKNTCLLYLQAAVPPTVIGGYRQWLAAGRQVLKGQHGMTIWFPSGKKEEEEEEQETEVHFLLGTVFDISQTAPVGA